MKNCVLDSVMMASLMAYFFSLNAYYLSFSFTHSLSIHPPDILVYFSYQSVGEGS